MSEKYWTPPEWKRSKQRNDFFNDCEKALFFLEDCVGIPSPTVIPSTYSAYVKGYKNIPYIFLERHDDVYRPYSLWVLLHEWMHHYQYHTGYLDTSQNVPYMPHVKFNWFNGVEIAYDVKNKLVKHEDYPWESEADRFANANWFHLAKRIGMEQSNVIIPKGMIDILSRRILITKRHNFVHPEYVRMGEYNGTR